jgi:hypothetical protein
VRGAASLNQRAARSAVAIREGMDGFELGVRQRGVREQADELRQAV